MSMFSSDKFAYKFPNSIEEIDSFSGKDFERFLFEYLKLDGMSPILTDDSGDRGIDIQVFQEVEGKKIKYGIQAKRWKQPVGSDEISKILQGKTYYGCDELWIITTSKLTAQAQNTALNNDIKILTRVDVIAILKEIKQNPKAKFTEIAHIESAPKEAKNLFKKIFTSNKIENTESSKAIPAPKDESKDIYGQLVELRKELAKEYNIQKMYMVYNNATIDSIIDVMPHNEKSLQLCVGLGDKKIYQFGDRILEVVKRNK